MADLQEHSLAHRAFDVPDCGRLSTAEVIHAYPGKRILTRATLADRTVVAKFYLGRWRGWYEWRRGLRGARALSRAGIASPPVRFAGYLPSAGAWLTVIDFIAVDEAWPPTATDAPDGIHRRMLETLATHHRRGILQNDLNWTNFLPAGGTLHSIDGDRVKSRPAPLDRRRSLRNLVRFYAYKSYFSEDTIARGYHIYCVARAWSPNPDEQARLVLRILRRRRAIAEGVAWRSLRGWKHFELRCTGPCCSIIDRRRLPAEDRRGLTDTAPPEEGAATPLERTVGGQRIRGRAISGPALPWRPGAVARAWQTVIVLRRLRIPAETPVGMVECRTGGVRTRGWVFTLNAGAVPLPGLAADDADRLRDALAELTTLLFRMRRAGLRLVRARAECFAVGPEGVLLADWTVVRRPRSYGPVPPATWLRDLRYLRRDLCRDFGLTPVEAAGIVQGPPGILEHSDQPPPP